ncbi:hypothetical protein ACHAW5_001228 [Stephanodiscus triporus]|uniref:Exoribonuclease phosphorolytic domain-containing protein n=1 Tax=Stephanodiscus triporus TaxID=2934178 RepID=A0ABD3MET2_9STRA
MTSGDRSKNDIDDDDDDRYDHGAGPPRPRRQCRRTRPHRGPTTFRPLSAELSSLSRSDGSASLRVGDTHVLCAIHGPTMPRNSRHERYDRGVMSVAFSRGMLAPSSGVGVGGEDEEDMADPPLTTTTTTTETAKSLPLPPGLGATEREMERFVRDSLAPFVRLEDYPRCVIQVVVQVIQADGSVLGTAVNCAVLALMDAGVAMRGVPVATTCVVFDERDDRSANVEDGGRGRTTTTTTTTTAWLDPTAEEESGGGGRRGIAIVVTDASGSSSSSSSSLPGCSDDYDYDHDHDHDDDEAVVAMRTFGHPASIDGITSAVEHSRRHGAPAMAAFFRLAIEGKVNREVRTLWS